MNQRSTSARDAVAIITVLSGRTLDVDQASLVKYHGSHADHHGLCWRVAQCACPHCETHRCHHSVLVTMATAVLDHVRPASFTALTDDDEVPAILRPCGGCGAQAGEACDLFCLLDVS